MELKANELRIGNLINVLNPNTDVWNIEATKGKTIMILQEKKGHHLLINNLKPIPLTEEWLLKFGFEETNAKENLDREWCVDYEIENCNFIINYNKTLNIFYFSFSNGINWINIEIYYIHQLQNLYFALTNEELEIKM